MSKYYSESKELNNLPISATFLIVCLNAQTTASTIKRNSSGGSFTSTSKHSCVSAWSRLKKFKRCSGYSSISRLIISSVHVNTASKMRVTSGLIAA